MENPAEETFLDKVKEWYNDNGVPAYGITALAIFLLVTCVLFFMDGCDDRLKVKQEVIEEKIEEKEEFIEDTYEPLLDSLKKELRQMEKGLEESKEQRNLWKDRYQRLKKSQRPLPNEIDGVSTAMFDTLDVVKQASKISDIIY